MKKKLKRIIIKYVIILVALLMPVIMLTSLTDYVIGSLFSPNWSTKRSDSMKDYINKLCNEQVVDKDFYHQDRIRCLRSQHVEQLIKYGMERSYYKTSWSDSKYHSLIKQIIKNDLKPKFKYKSYTIETTVKYEKKIVVYDDTDNKKHTEWIPAKDVAKENIKLLVDSDTMYYHETFSYKDNVQTSSTGSGHNKVTTTIKKPMLDKTTKGPSYERLKKFLKSMGVNMKNKADVNYAIQSIVSTSDEWLKGKGDPSDIIFGIDGDSNLADVSGISGVPSKYVPYFNKAAKATGIPAWFLAAIANVESNFTTNATSCVGAIGMMQMMPGDFPGYYAQGLKEYLAQNGKPTSSEAQAMSEYRSDAQTQILVGAFIMRNYLNLTLYKLNIVSSINYCSTSNMSKINWKASANDKKLMNILYRALAGYNAGPLGITYKNPNVTLGGYPAKVYNIAMNYRTNTIESNNSGGNSKIVKAAKKYLGIPYVWGGKSPSTGFDCSGFVYYVYYHDMGIYIGMGTGEQSNRGRLVSINDLKEGDLIFMDTEHSGGITHVVMYIGNGMIIHAPQTGKSIEIVSLQSTKSWGVIKQCRRYL